MSLKKLQTVGGPQTVISSAFRALAGKGNLEDIEDIEDISEKLSVEEFATTARTFPSRPG